MKDFPTVITSPALPLIKQSGSAPSVLVAGIFFFFSSSFHLSGFPALFSRHITGVCNYILIFILKEKELPFQREQITSLLSLAHTTKDLTDFTVAEASPQAPALIRPLGSSTQQLLPKIKFLFSKALVQKNFR